MAEEIVHVGIREHELDAAKQISVTCGFMYYIWTLLTEMN
jgi:hypothetical protein